MSSPAPRIFITGVAGYVGGNLVVDMVVKHPDWHVVTLVRSEVQKATVLARWPGVEVVIGDLDDKDLMIEEGAKADVILQTASADHIPGVLALIEGASLRKGGPAYFLHVGGTGMLHEVPNGFGQPSSKIYHDVADLAEITSLPEEGHVHRDVDMAILAAQKKFNVPTAIVSPPLIHGVGKGPLKTRSIQIPALAEAILKRGRGFQVLEGKNIWDGTHMDDISSAFILLAEQALQNGGKAQWGQDGYYFADGAEFQWGDIATAITKIASDKGYIFSADVDKVSPEDAAALHPWAPLIWGGNARGRSDRLRALGWKPTGTSIYESLPAMVDTEAKTLGSQSQKTTFDL